MIIIRIIRTIRTIRTSRIICIIGGRDIGRDAGVRSALVRVTDGATAIRNRPPALTDPHCGAELVLVLVAEGPSAGQVRGRQSEHLRRVTRR